MTLDVARPAPGTILTLDQLLIEDTYYGVHVAACGEDGEPLLAIGSHNLRRVIAALSRYTREVYGQRLRDYLMLCDPGCTYPWCRRHGCHTPTNALTQCWLTFHAPDPATDDDEEPDYVWRFEEAGADTPGAIPVVSV